MQTITSDEFSNVSVFIFEDDVVLDIQHDRIICPGFVIGDLNSSNSTHHTGVTPPGDWDNCKYLFDGTTWTSNPKFEVVSPIPEV